MTENEHQQRYSGATATEPNPAEYGGHPYPQYAAPAPEAPKKPMSQGKKVAVAAAVAAGVIATGGVAYAAVHANSSSTSNQQGGPGGAGGGFPGGGGQGGGPGGMGGAGSVLGTALHGEFTTSDGATALLQTGTVSDVSSTSITLKSTDGYTHTYVVSGSTSVDGGNGAISDVSAGDTVTVVATESGDTATATTLTDTTVLGTTNQGIPGGAAGQAGTTSGGTN